VIGLAAVTQAMDDAMIAVFVVLAKPAACIPNEMKWPAVSFHL